MMSTKRTGKIFILEDDQKWSDILEKIIRRLDRRLDTIELKSYVAKNVEEAEEKIREHSYHVWLIDLNMKRQNQMDRQGLEFLSNYFEKGMAQAVDVFVVSGYPRPENIIDSFELGVSKFFRKQVFDTEEFLQALQEIFDPPAGYRTRQDVTTRMNLDLNIIWNPVTCEEAIEGLKIETADGDVFRIQAPRNDEDEETTRRRDRARIEIEDLLCRLFFKVDSIQVRPLNPGRSGAVVLLTRPHNGGPQNPVVTKIGDILNISKEYQNYRNHVQDRVQRAPEMKTFTRNSLLGGIVYSFARNTLGNELENFEDFYHQHDADDIKAVITEIFNQTCGNWYAQVQTQPSRDLKKEYSDLLSLTDSKLDESFERLKRIITGNKFLSVSGLDIAKNTLHNPLPILKDHPTIMVPGAEYSISHGDLNARNILISTGRHPLLIDFRHTEPGHMLRDFAKLDAVVRYELLPTDEATLEERYHLEEKLNNPHYYTELNDLPDNLDFGSPALNKAYQVVCHIRQEAGHMRMPSRSMQQYYLALLFYGVAYTSYYPLEREIRGHALLAASSVLPHLKDYVRII